MSAAELAAALCAIVVVAACQPKPYAQLEQRCDDLGGQVVDYGPSGYDCLVDGKFVGLQVAA